MPLSHRITTVSLYNGDFLAEQFFRISGDSPVGWLQYLLPASNGLIGAPTYESWADSDTGVLRPTFIDLATGEIAVRVSPRCHCLTVCLLNTSQNIERSIELGHEFMFHMVLDDCLLLHLFCKGAASTEVYKVIRRSSQPAFTMSPRSSILASSTAIYKTTGLRENFPPAWVAISSAATHRRAHTMCHTLTLWLL